MLSTIKEKNLLLREQILSFKSDLQLEGGQKWKSWVTSPEGMTIHLLKFAKVLEQTVLIQISSLIRVHCILITTVFQL